MLIVNLMETWRFENSLAGNAGVTVVVAEDEAELIGVAETVTDIGGECAVQERIVGALAVRLEIGSGSGVIEFAEQSAELRAALTGRETAAIGVNAEFRDARRAAMREELDDAINGVGAVHGAFGAADDFDFIDVVEGEVGKIYRAAGGIDGGTIDEHLGEIRIAAIEKNGGGAAFGTGASDGNVGRKEQRVGQRDPLRRIDLIFRDDRDGRGRLIGKRRFSLGRDNNAGRKALERQGDVEIVPLTFGDVDYEIAGNKGRTPESKVIAASRNSQFVGAIGRRNCVPELSAGLAFELSGDVDARNAGAAGIQKRAKNASV